MFVSIVSVLSGTGPCSAQQSELAGAWLPGHVLSGVEYGSAAVPYALKGDARIVQSTGLRELHESRSWNQPDVLAVGGQGWIETTAAGAVVDTSGSYTVSAFVKLSSLDGYQTFVAMDGKSASGFYLQYRPDIRTFSFTTLPKDESGSAPAAAAQWNPGVRATAFDAAKAGRWYWLVGVHDAAKHTQSLYVDGRLRQVLHYDDAWSASGPVTIGRGFWGGKPADFAHGEIAEALVFRGVHRFDAGDVEMARAVAARADKAASTPVSVALDMAAPEKPSSPELYGLMIEDINHSIDGGLYAELIQNRDFDFDAAKPVHWSSADLSKGAGARTEIEMALDSNQIPPGTGLKTSLRVLTSEGESVATTPGSTWGYEIANDGYWGVPVKPNTRYHVSFCAEGFASGGTQSKQMQVYARLEDTPGHYVYAGSPAISVNSQWKQYSCVLQTGSEVKPDANGRFAIASSTLGTLWLAHVSVMGPTYNDRANGARPDLMATLGAMRPAFLRMPGGNFLEGNHVGDQFPWKTSLGPTADRPGHANPWGYPSTDGFGLLEYLEWCQDLHMQPVLAVYAGYSLSGDYVKPGADLAPYVQDAVDEIEYVTGDAKTTKWGAERAADGHPAPFPLKYVEVGNEDWFDKSGSYESGRFAQFFDAIRAKYPALKIIATTNAVKSRAPDLIDEHYYLYPQQFVADANHYDKVERSGPKTFVGEWASQEGSPTPDMGACLGDAAWMCGMERNSDQVLMASYAPLLVNVNTGASQWGTDLIGFDGLTCAGSPTYYAQAMFAARHGEKIVPLSVAGNAAVVGSATLTRAAGGNAGGSVIYLKLVNVSGVAVPARIALRGLSGQVSKAAAVETLDADPFAANSIKPPLLIKPRASAIGNASEEFSYRLPPYSVTVMTLRATDQRK